MQAGYRISKLVPVKQTNDLTSFKIDIISLKKSTIARIYHELIKHNLHQLVTISHSSSRLIEITPFGINKGYAVNYFAKKYNISKNEIVSIGDSFNDLSAFRNSALSIGIHPKNPNFLEHCDAVINHKSNGVRQAIEDYLIKDVDNETFKLIFTDLDGTLIDNKTKLFSNATKIALQQCTNHLIPIAIASGRSIHDGIRIVESMELNPKTNIYIIGNNGATIFDIFTQKYISQSPIDEVDAKKIFNILVDYAKKANGKLGFIIYQHSIDLLFYNEPF
ncbi:MAG: HAD-IIB family hydrolase [Mycoplasmoidaceae bacterium]|nr:HAD-IIB family hydrolase [Mycoplasmoidaceae bacterium]